MKEKKEPPGMCICLELNSSVHSFIHSFCLSCIYRLV
jgi:hypothetical protein